MPRKIKAAKPEEPPLESIRPISDKRADKAGTGFERMLTPKDESQFLRVSLSWLAKARMRGDGPPYVKVGRAIRYSESALLLWIRAHQRLSTSQQ